MGYRRDRIWSMGSRPYKRYHRPAGHCMGMAFVCVQYVFVWRTNSSLISPGDRAEAASFCWRCSGDDGICIMHKGTYNGEATVVCKLLKLTTQTVEQTPLTTFYLLSTNRLIVACCHDHLWISILYTSVLLIGAKPIFQNKSYILYI